MPPSTPFASGLFSIPPPECPPAASPGFVPSPAEDLVEQTRLLLVSLSRFAFTFRVYSNHIRLEPVSGFRVPEHGAGNTESPL